MSIDKLILIVLLITALVVCIVICIWLVLLNRFGENFQKPHKPMLRVTYCVITFFVISMVSGIATEYISNNDISNDMNYYTILICNTVNTVTWNIAQIFIYILLIARVYYGFNDTEYAASKKVYLTFTILLLLYAFAIGASIMYVVIHSQYYHESRHKYNINQQNDIGDIYVIGTEIIDLIISIFLIYLFVQKMTLVTVDLDTSEWSIMNDKVIFNEQQKNLMNIMTKYFILSFIATATTQIEMITLCIYWSGIYAHYFYIIYQWLLPVDAIINTICLFLIFEINENIYSKCCNCCHSCIGSCFKRKAKLMSKKRYKNKQHALEMELLGNQGNDKLISASYYEY